MRPRDLLALLGNEKLRFLIVGAWNTLVGYLIFLAFHFTIEPEFGVLATLVASYCLALPHSFITQRLLVFRSARAWAPEFGRFVLSNSSIFLANIVLLPIAKSATQANTAILQAIFLAASTVAGYLAHKYFTFSR